MRDVNRMDLTRVDTQATKEGLTLTFRFRRETAWTDDDGVKHRFDKEESIEVTVGKTLEDAKAKLTSVVNAIDGMIIEGE